MFINGFIQIPAKEEVERKAREEEERRRAAEGRNKENKTAAMGILSPRRGRAFNPIGRIF